jgi:hypothetical protein
MLVDPTTRPAAVEGVAPRDRARLAAAGEERHLVVHQDVLGPHPVEVVLVAGRKPFQPGHADQLLPRPAGDVGEVLVREGDPAVQVEGHRQQVDVLEHVAQPPLRRAHLLDLGAQVGLQALGLDRHRGGAAHRIDQARLLRRHGRVYEDRDDLAVVLDLRRHPVSGRRGQRDVLAVRVQILIRTRAAVGNLERRVAERDPERAAQPTRGVLVAQGRHQRLDRAAAIEPRAQDPEQVADRDRRERDAEGVEGHHAADDPRDLEHRDDEQRHANRGRTGSPGRRTASAARARPGSRRGRRARPGTRSPARPRSARSGA